MFLELLIILLLILINGIFAMSEISLVSARKARLESAAKRGDKNAKRALELQQHPNRFFSTVQVGITLIGILMGIFSGASLTEKFQLWLERWPAFQVYSHSIAITLVVIVITYFSLVLGELVPKRIGLTYPEGISKVMARPMTLLSYITYPFIWLLTQSTDLIIKLLNIKPTSESKVTEEEIKAIIQEGADGGEIEEIEQDIVERVFHLGDRTISSLMTHRADLVWLDSNDPIEVNKEKILEEIHSVYPLCEEELDRVIGLVYIKDLFATNINGAFNELKSYVKEALFIPENVSAYTALERMKEQKKHHALVIDEYGAVQGIITMKDILEALVGDITEFNEEDYEIIEREDGTWLVDAQLPFYDFVQYFEIENLYPLDVNDFNTLGGFVLHILEHIPKAGDKFNWKEFIFEIVDMDANRIDKILVSKEQPVEAT
ncbi:MAG: hemolysin family protein [Chitinophagales bacterium]|nr:hemolysin family protein [Chitinophagales bacterium]